MPMTPEQLQAFAERLQKARTPWKKATAFCRAVGITRTTLRALERGRQQPTIRTLERLATVLKVPWTDLTGAPRIDPDHPLLADLREEDLRVAQMFHHAGLLVKQRVLGVLQEREPPHDVARELAPEVTAVAEHLLALDPARRYRVSQDIVDLAALALAAVGTPIDPEVLAWGTRVVALPETLRASAKDRIRALEHTLTRKEQPGGSRPPPKKR